MIKNSITRRLILEYDGLFLFPEPIFAELKKHKSALLIKSGMSQKYFMLLLNLLLQKVMIVPEKILQHHREEALSIIKNIDPDDVLFIACGLAHPNSILWSDDKALKKQKKIVVLNTNDVKDYLSASI